MQAAKPLGCWVQELICYQCHLANVVQCRTSTRELEAQLVNFVLQIQLDHNYPTAVYRTHTHTYE